MSRPFLDALLASRRVQEVLPNLGSELYLEHLHESARDAESGYPRTQSGVKEQIVAVATSLDNHERSATIWRSEYKKQIISPIRYLLARLTGLVDSPFPAESQLTTSAGTRGNRDSGNIAPPYPNKLLTLGHEDFEYLYYVVLFKLGELYHDLQIRFANGFINMDHQLHNHDVDGCAKSVPFTVAGMKRFVILAWHMFHDATFTSILNHEIKTRKIRNMALTFVSPADTSAIQKTTPGLQDIKNPVAFLDKFYRKYRVERDDESDDAAMEQQDEAKAASTDYQGSDLSMIRGETLEDSTMHQHNPEASSLHTSLHQPVPNDSSLHAPNSEPSVESVKRPTQVAVTDDVSCKCEVHCECKFVCNDIKDRCLCALRELLRHKCKCDSLCKCKFVCNKLENNCICTYLEEPLGELAHKQQSPPAQVLDRPDNILIPSEENPLTHTRPMPIITSPQSESPDKTGRLQTTALAVPRFPVRRLNRNSRDSTTGERKPIPPPKSLYHSNTSAQKSHRPQEVPLENRKLSSDLHLGLRVPFTDGELFGPSHEQSNEEHVQQNAGVQYRHPSQKRYVSAGGNLPLEQRPTIPPPSFAVDGTAHAHSIGVPLQNPESAPDKKEKLPRKPTGERAQGNKILNKVFKQK